MFKFADTHCCPGQKEMSVFAWLEGGLIGVNLLEDNLALFTKMFPCTCPLARRTFGQGGWNEKQAQKEREMFR